MITPAGRRATVTVDVVRKLRGEALLRLDVLARDLRIRDQLIAKSLMSIELSSVSAEKHVLDEPACLARRRAGSTVDLESRTQLLAS
jgi:hypothetical protein